MSIGDPQSKWTRPTQAVRLTGLGFDVMSVQSPEGLCPYCFKSYKRGEWTAWAAGIIKGHVDCIEAAWQARSLIIGPMGAHNRTGRFLARARSAEDSWEALRGAGTIIGPVECFMDQRFEHECLGQYNICAARCDGCISRSLCRDYTKMMPSLERKVFERGKSKWPTLYEDDQEALKDRPMEYEEFDCMGSYEKENEDHDDCRCCEDADECKRVTERADAKAKILAQLKYGQPGPVPLVGRDFFECEHFQPIRIAVLVMHERSRPSPRQALEMEKSEFLDLVEKQWEGMAAKALADWKRKNGRNLPFCPEHIFLETKMLKVENRAFLRELWLVCPGTGIKRGI